MIFVGIALAIITLIVEYWYYKYKKPDSRISTGSDKVAKQLKVKSAMNNQGFNNQGFYGDDRAPIPTIDKN